VFYLVNTFEADDSYFGRVESVHRSADNAKKAGDKLKKEVRKNSPGSYLELSVVQLQWQHKPGQWVKRSDLIGGGGV